jgi:hypothetical protein
MAFPLSDDRKRLTRTGAGPDFCIVMPAGEPERIRPATDAGKEMTLAVPSEVGRPDIDDRSLVNVAGGDLFVPNKLAKPLCGIGFFLVVVGTQDGSYFFKADCCAFLSSAFPRSQSEQAISKSIPAWMSIEWTASLFRSPLIHPVPPQVLHFSFAILDEVIIYDNLTPILLGPFSHDGSYYGFQVKPPCKRYLTISSF